MTDRGHYADAGAASRRHPRSPRDDYTSRRDSRRYDNERDTRRRFEDEWDGRRRLDDDDRRRYEDERPRRRYDDDVDGRGGRRKDEEPRRRPSRSRSPPRRRSRSPPPRRRSSPPPPSSNALDHRRSLSPASRARELEGPPPTGSEAEADANAGKPNFGASGKLAAETNLYKGVVLKYHEPPEARKPGKSWRVYVFKGKEEVDLWHLHRQSAFLVGRDRVVADIPVDHPSTSKQHAVLQFRQVRERNEFGDTKTLIKPFIIDLESANGTTVNDEKIPPSRFYELKSGDVIKFAFSTREYVLLAEAQ